MTERLRSVPDISLDADVPDLLASIASAGERQAHIRRWLEATLQQARIGGPSELPCNQPCMALLQAWLADESGDFSSALAHITQAHAFWQNQANIAVSLLAQLVRASVLLRAGDLDGARANAQEALCRATALGRRDIAAHALNCLALIAWATGTPIAARTHVQNALKILGPDGDVTLRTLLLLNRAAIRHAIAARTGEAKQGRGHYLSCTDARNAAAEASHVPDIWLQALCFSTQARCELEWLKPQPYDITPGSQYHERLTFLELIRLAGNIPRLQFAPIPAQAEYSQNATKSILSAFNRYSALWSLLQAEQVLQQTRVTRLTIVYDMLNTSVWRAQTRIDELLRLIEQFQQNLYRLNQEAQRDSLTGLANRRHEQEVFSFLDADRTRSYAILMIDIDHFKSINDRFSHAVGDQVLIKLAQLLTSCTKPVDVVVRHGGEEFLVILLDERSKDAASISERIRAAIEATSLPPFPISITVSIGIAFAKEVPGGTAAIITMADSRLYQAKRKGRNCVIAPPGSLP